ncbi:MAG: BrnT family toxin [Chroococcidiopsidaceae cyanobacterium CP_BM_RX_35]|nr:BrnT family toxin [Chroococcidiopsidaceae cyanobacterium CP_BM_RX_35]
MLLASGEADGESRYVIIGVSRFGQLLIVSHTDRGEKVRIISARKATPQERRFYEEGS